MYDDTDEWGDGQGFTAGLICKLKPGLLFTLNTYLNAALNVCQHALYYPKKCLYTQRLNKGSHQNKSSAQSQQNK